MNRVRALSIFLTALMLTACARNSPIVATTPGATAVVEAAPTTTSGLGGLGGFSSLGEPTAAPTATPSTTYIVQRGPIEDVLSFSGQVSAMQSVMSFAQDGIVKQIFVEPGQTINKGDLVSELDIGDLQSQLTEARLTTAQAQQALDQAVQAGQLAVQQAQLLVEAARQELEQAKQPPTALAIAQAQTAVREAQASLDTVRNNASQVKNQAKAEMDKAVVDLTNIQEEYAKTVTQLQKAKGEAAKELNATLQDLEQQMRDAEAAVATAVINYDTARNNEVAAVKDAEAKLDLAQAQLDELLKGADKFLIAEKERAVRSAEIAVAQARQSAAADPSLVKAVESGRLQIEQIQDQIAARQLYAPISGEVATVNVNIGDPVQLGSPVITLIDRSRLELMASGSSILATGRTSLPQLTMNQAVEIVFSRYPDKVFSGTISQAPAAGTATADSTYHVAFDPQGLSFDPGDLAELKIVLGRKYDVLYLPPAAIQATRDRSVVTLRSDGTDKRVDVLIGITTPDKIEILSGLSEGDVVVGR